MTFLEQTPSDEGALLDAAVASFPCSIPIMVGTVVARLKNTEGTFAATFFLACIAALEMEGVRLEDI